MAFSNIYQLSVYKSRIEGLDNEKLSELAIQNAEDMSKRIDQNPNATGIEDSPLEAGHPVVKQLRDTIKRTIHNSSLYCIS